MGNGVYNYDYSGFKIVLSISELNSISLGDYEIKLQINIDEHLKTKFTNLKTNINSAPILGANIFQFYTDNNNEARLNIDYYIKNGYVDIPKIEKDLITLQGWSNVERINTLESDDSHKLMIIKNQEGMEQLRIEGKSEYRPDVTNAVGNGVYNYDYSGYKFNIDSNLVGMLEDGLYIIDIFDCYPNSDVKAVTVPANITLIQGEISGIYVEIAVSDQIYLKIDRKGVTNLEDIKVTEDHVILSGWAILKGSSSINYNNKLIIVDDTNQVVYSQSLKSINRKDVAELFASDGVDYSNSGFEVDIPRKTFSNLYGTYDVFLELSDGKNTKRISLLSSKEEISFVQNNIVTLKNNNSTYNLEIHITSPIVNGYIETPTVQASGIMLSGWSNIEGVNLNYLHDSNKLILVKDMSGKEYMRWYGKAVYRPDVTQVMGNQKYNYDYSGYEFIIDYDKLNSLTLGQYIIDIYSEYGNSYIKSKTVPTSNNLIFIELESKRIEIGISDQIYLKVTNKK